MTPDELSWEEYRERAKAFREMVYEADPGHSPRAPLMRFPGSGNREERRALRAKAKRNR